MIDTISRGIKTMYAKQRERHFPMPDFLIDNNKQEVNVKIYGKVIDERYAQLLASGTQLSLKECIWLDAIQKQKYKLVTKPALEILKSRKLIEGHAPNYIISLAVAKKTKQIGEYTRLKGLEKEKFFNMILEFVKNGSPEGVLLKDIFNYLDAAMPKDREVKNQKRLVGRFLEMLKEKNKITCVGRKWSIQ